MTDLRTDDALMRAHVSGDRSAFEELVRRHRDRLWAVAMRTLADREEAADAVQDALLAAYRGAERFRGDSAVTTWLHRIVVNACLDRLRRRQVRPTVPLPEPDSPALVGRATTLPDVATEVTVRDALRGLPDEQRMVLILVDMEGFPVADVAAMLGIAEGTVKSRCARGRARLAVALGHLRLGDADGGPGRAGAPPPPPRGSGRKGNREAIAAVGSDQGNDDAEGVTRDL